MKIKFIIIALRHHCYSSLATIKLPTQQKVTNHKYRFRQMLLNKKLIQIQQIWLKQFI